MRIPVQNIFYLISAVQLLLTSCNSNSHKQNIASTTRMSPDSTIIESSSLNKVDTTFLKSSKQIIGAWNVLDKEGLTVDIKKQTFYYREHHEEYKYKFVKDSILIYFREATISGKPYFINDTLLIRSGPAGDMKYVRLKE